MTQNPLTQTRQSLYDLVWSTPMSTLALDFGTTDVGLAKRCRAHRIAYWTRSASRRRVSRSPCAFLPYRSDEDLLEKSLLRCFNLDGDLPSKVLAAQAAPADTDGHGDTDDD